MFPYGLLKLARENSLSEYHAFWLIHISLNLMLSLFKMRLHLLPSPQYSSPNVACSRVYESMSWIAHNPINLYYHFTLFMKLRQIS